MDLKLLSIGEMARINHVSKQTLRHYEREGLLLPAVTDPDTGYRYYTIVQSAKLDLIQRLKLYGLTLKEIKQSFTENNNEASFQEQLKTQLEECDRLIASISAMKRAIQASICNNERYRLLPKDSSIFLEPKKERYLYVHHTEKEYFNHGYEGFESALRGLKTVLETNDIPWLQLMKAGTLIRREDLEADQIRSTDIFVITDYDSVLKGCIRIPQALYCCICCTSFDKELSACHQLLESIRHRRYKIIGDCLVERIVDFPDYHDDRRNAFSQIQIPVEF